MAEVSKERILELKKIIKEDYGRELSFAEASEAANNLVGFFDLLLKIDTRENSQKYTKKTKSKNK